LKGVNPKAVRSKPGYKKWRWILKGPSPLAESRSYVLQGSHATRQVPVANSPAASPLRTTDYKGLFGSLAGGLPIANAACCTRAVVLLPLSRVHARRLRGGGGGSRRALIIRCRGSGAPTISATVCT